MKTQRNILIAATVFLALAASPLAATSSTCTPQQEADILALFAQWNRSLATGDAAKVDANYARDAVLIPTLSNQIRNTPAGRIAYFKEEFIPKKPSGEIDKHYLNVAETSRSTLVFIRSLSVTTPRLELAILSFIKSSATANGSLSSTIRRKCQSPNRSVLNRSETHVSFDLYRSTISLRWIQTLFTMPRPNMIMSTKEPL